MTRQLINALDTITSVNLGPDLEHWVSIRYLKKGT